MSSAQSYHMTEARTWPVALALNLLVLICALFSFLMARDGIDSGTGWIYLLCLVPACAVMMAEGSGVSIPRPPSFLTFGVALCLLIPILMQMNRFRIAEPLLEAILLLFVVRVLERKTPREYVQIALIMLAALVVYALLSVERLFLTVCMGMGVCSSLMLMLAAWMRREPEARLSLTDGGRLLMRALGMFAVMLPLCLLLFFVAPRVRSPFRMLRGGWGGLTGFSDELTLGDIENIQQSGRLAFRAEMPDISPRTPYWRGVVLSFFNGNTWIVNLAGRAGGWRESAEGQTVRQTILLEPSAHRWLFALDRPLSVQGGSAMRLGNGTFARRFQLYGSNQAQYEAVSTLAPIVTVAPLSQRAEAIHLQLPEDYSPAIRRFTEDVVRDASTDREKMTAVVARLVGEDYQWSLTGLSRGRNALEDFLLSRRRGNCEYFASAAGVMLRMAGVPARLVGGYKGGEYNNAGGYYAVRDYMAHVWVEAWDRDAKAWIRLDPTPSTSEGGAGVVATDSGTWSEFWDYLDYQWNRYFVAYGGESQAQWAGALRQLLSNPRASLSASTEGLAQVGQGALAVALPLGLALLAIAGGWTLWRFLHRDPRLALLGRFERLMARRGVPRRRSEGLEEFAQRLPEPLRGGALAFAFDMNAALYSGRGMDAALRDRLVRELADLSAPSPPRRSADM